MNVVKSVAGVGRVIWEREGERGGGVGGWGFFFNDTATTEIYTLSLHDALPISLYLLLHICCWLMVVSHSAVNFPKRERMLGSEENFKNCGRKSNSKKT